MIRFLEQIKKYYPQVLLEGWKYIINEKRVRKYITNHLDIFTDEENSAEENSDQENYIE